MRGDFNQEDEILARTESEQIEQANVLGFNALKIVRYLNLIAGTTLSICCGFRIFSLWAIISNPLNAIGLMIFNAYML
jgi:hypothetical protein